MILFIDSTDLKKVTFAIITDKSVKKKVINIPYEENYKTLEHLDKFLRDNNLQPTAYNLLQSVVVSSGPGSFTGLRVAASLAQGIKLATGVPIAVVKKVKVPKDLKKLANMKLEKTLDLDYGKPAMY